MNEQEISEIRRRFRHDKSNIQKIRGCYVNEKGEIISEFDQSLSLMSEADSESLLKIIKKTLSGSIGKNLIDIEFTTQQVCDSEEHKLLMDLRETELENDDLVQQLYEKIIKTIKFDGNYLILLAFDKYDIPVIRKDGFGKEDESDEIFAYYLCSICPVKQIKSALGFYASENEFRNIRQDYVVSAPELGFMFPAFDDRSANIYNALYYTKNTSESHNDFTDAIFHTEPPMPATIQMETFQNVIAESVEEDCSFDFMQAVHTTFTEMVDEHKEYKKEEPLVLTKSTIKDVFKACGASPEHIEAFEEKFDESFGAEAQITPTNIVDTKHFEIQTADVKIQVSPDRSHLIETKIIDGTKYIMIRAEGGVEVNGVNIHFDEKNTDNVETE